MTLNKRDAALRSAALRGIGGAMVRLDSSFIASGAFRHTLYNHPRAALRSIASAEARLAKAKRALRVWARG